MKRTSTSPSHRPSPGQVALCSIFALWVFTGLYPWSVLYVPRPESGYTTLWEGWVGNGSYFAAAALILLRAARVRDRRAGFVWLGSGAVLNAVAGLVYLYLDQDMDPIPFPGSPPNCDESTTNDVPPSPDPTFELQGDHRALTSPAGVAGSASVDGLCEVP